MLRIQSDHLSTAGGRDVPRGFRRLSTAVEQALSSLRKLETPGDDKAAVARIFEQTELGLAVIRRAQRDRGLATRIAQGQLNPLAGAAQAASAYGLTDCLAF